MFYRKYKYILVYVLNFFVFLPAKKLKVSPINECSLKSGNASAAKAPH